MTSRRRGLAASALLAGAVIALYFPVVFQGASLVYSDNFNPLDHRGLAGNYGPGFVPIEELWARNVEPLANLHDGGGALWQWEPFATLMHRSLRDGELPWWDPYSGAGSPGLVSLNPTPFFPPYLAVVALGSGTGVRNVYALLLQLGSALALYAFLRRHELGTIPSLFGAVAWIASGAMAQNVASMIGQTLSCAPYPLLASRLWLDRPTPKSAALLSATFAAVALSTFPPVLIGIFLLTATYVASALVAERGEPGWRSMGSRSLRFAGLSLVALALVGFYYVPAIRSLDAAPYLDRFYDHAWREKISPANFLQLWSSPLAGGAKLRSNPWMPPKDPARELPYVGGAVLLAAAFVSWRSLGARGRLLLVWAASMATLFAAKLVRLPLLDSISKLPLLRTVHAIPYFGFMLALLAALLAALGLEALSRSEHLRARWAAAAAVGALFAAGTAWLARERGVLGGEFAALWLAEWRWSVGLLVAAFGGLVWIGLARDRPRWRAAGLALFACAFGAEIARVHFQHRQPRWDVFRNPPAHVTWLQRSVGLQRVMCFAALSPNLGSAFGIHQVESEMTVSSPRLRELYFAATGSKSPLFVTDGVRLPSPAFFARAAVRFLVISDWAPRALEEARQRGYREAFHDGRNSIFEVSGLPRYFFTSSYRIVTAEAAKRSALGSRALRTLLLEEQPSFTPLPNREPEAEVEVRDYRLNRYRLAVTTDRAGLVSMAESRMPGWTATVNGRDVPILAANYAFRAVEVPAGTSVIEMRYRPPGLRAGALASALGLIGIGAVLLVRPRRS